MTKQTCELKAVSILPVQEHGGRVQSTWAEPFAAMFWRMRVQSGVLALSVISTAILGFLVVRMATGHAALVYVIEPNGHAQVVQHWIGSSLPVAHEASYVASTFVELLYGRNSSTVHENIAQAVSMCSVSMQGTLRDELATMGFVERVQTQQVRSETEITQANVIEQSQTHFVVHMMGNSRLYPLTRYDGDPAEVRPFNVRVGLRVVDRDPEHRRNGLEVVSLSEAAQ